MSAAETIVPPPASEVASEVASEMALEAAYKEHFDFVRRSLARLGVERESVDDAAQDVFVVAVRRITEFEGRAKLRTWLFAIAQRVAQRKQRDRFRHSRRLSAVYASRDASQASTDPSAKQDAVRTLALLLAEVDEAARLVFVLVELEGMSAVEVAAGLGENVNTIYSRLRKGRRQIQAAAAELRKADTETGGTP